MSFSIKFDKKSADKLEGNVRAAFQKVIRSQAMLNEVGQLVVTDVVEQTRNEKSIPLKKDLRLLKEKWITRKSKIVDTNQTSPFYEEGKSNLTFTGQLLNSFTWAIEGVGKIRLFFQGTHQPYKNIDGTTSGKSISNEDLAKYVADGGRPFVGVRPAIKRRVNRIVKTYLKRALIVARLTKNEVD
jgi:hypothetical protein